MSSMIEDPKADSQLPPDWLGHFFLLLLVHEISSTTEGSHTLAGGRPVRAHAPPIAPGAAVQMC